jgi:hypothetical protein
MTDDKVAGEGPYDHILASNKEWCVFYCPECAYQAGRKAEREMNKRYLLYTQFPQVKKKGIGVLAIGTDGDASFFDESGGEGCKIIARMERVRISFAGADGIMLSGFENCGVDGSGKNKFRYQDWWLSYNEKP